MTDLLALAERCEQATGPDRELDARIEAALAEADFDALANDGVHVRDWNAPAYTASIDAAMSLVPEGREWRVRWCELPDGTWASIARIGENGCGLNTSAATPALALCAAALRARATLSEDAK